MRQGVSGQDLFVGLVWTLGAAYVVFWACAPTAALTPMAPRGGAEIGGGVTATTNVADEDDLTGVFSAGLPVGFDSQAWFEHREGVFSLGVVVFLGQTSIAGVGVFTRLTVVDTDSVTFGTELQFGTFWAALAFPTSFRLDDGARLTLNPSFGLRAIALQLPLGVALDIGGDQTLNLSLAAETPYPNKESTDEWYLEPPTGLRLGLGIGKTLK